jgi:hypothetical protein
MGDDRRLGKTLMLSYVDNPISATGVVLQLHTSHFYPLAALGQPFSFLLQFSHYIA